jgi:hypothetical protein
VFQATRWVHGCAQAKLALSLSNLTFQAAQWVHGNGHWVDQSEESNYWADQSEESKYWADQSEERERGLARCCAMGGRER